MIKELEFLFESIWHFLGILVLVHVARKGLTDYQKGLTWLLSGLFGGISRFIGVLFRGKSK